jgi:hypothetical protein
MSRPDWQIYEDALILKGEGFPLWQADPGEQPPPEIGTIGYFEYTHPITIASFWLTLARNDRTFKVLKTLDLVSCLAGVPGILPVTNVLGEKKRKQYPDGIYQVNARSKTLRGEIVILPLIQCVPLFDHDAMIYDCYLREFGLQGATQARVYEGARLRLRTQEIEYQSVQKRFLKPLGDYLLRNLQSLRRECYLEHGEDLVLITGTGTTGNWEADTIVLDESSITAGAGAQVPTIASGGIEMERSRACYGNPGFNTGHVASQRRPEILRTYLLSSSTSFLQSTTEQGPATSSFSVEDTEPNRFETSSPSFSTWPQSPTQRQDPFPQRIPFQRCCRGGERCSCRNLKQYVFVKTARIRSRPLLGRILERVSVEMPDSLAAYTRWGTSLSRKPLAQTIKHPFSNKLQENPDQASDTDKLQQNLSRGFSGLWRIKVEDPDDFNTYTWWKTSPHRKLGVEELFIDPMEGQVQLGDAVGDHLKSEKYLDRW